MLSRIDAHMVSPASDHPRFQQAIERYGLLRSVYQTDAQLQQEVKKHGNTPLLKKRQAYLRIQKIKHGFLLIVHYILWGISLFIPGFGKTGISLSENVKTILRNPQFRPLRLAFISWMFLTAVFSYGTVRFVLPSLAATYTWDGGGVTNNWSDCDNWSTDVCPTSSDLVLFDGTSSKDAVIDSSFGGGSGSVGGIKLCDGTNCGSGSYTGTVTQQRTFAVGSSHFSQYAGTFVGSSSTLHSITITGNAVFEGGNFISNSGQFSISGDITVDGGAVDFSEALNVSMGDSGVFHLSSGIVTSTQGVWSLLGFSAPTWDHTGGTFVPNGGTIEFAHNSNGTPVINVPTTFTFDNLSINTSYPYSGGTVSISSGDTVIVSDTLYLKQGGFTSGGNLHVTGNIEHFSGFRGGNGVVFVTSTSSNIQTVSLQGSSDGYGKLPGIVIDSPYVTVFATTSHRLYMSSDFTLKQGTVNYGTAPVTYAYSFSQTGGSIAHTSGNIYFDNTFTCSSGNFDTGSGTTTFSDDFSASGCFIDFSDASAVVVPGDVSISGGFVTSTSNELRISGFGNPTLDIQSPQYFYHNEGSIVFNHNSNGEVYIDTQNGVTTTFHSLSFGLTYSFGNPYVHTNAEDTIVLLGDISITESSRLIGTNPFYVKGNFINTSEKISTKPLTFIGEGAQSITFGSGTAGSSYDGDILIQKPSGTTTLMSNITLNAANQDLYIATSSIFDTNGYDLFVSGSGSVFSLGADALLYMEGDETVSQPSMSSESIIVFDGTGTYSLPSWTFPNLYLYNGNFRTNGNDLTVEGVFENQGTLQVRGSETLDITNDTDSGTIMYIGDGDDELDMFVYHDIPFYNLAVSSTDGLDIIGPTSTAINPYLSLASDLEVYYAFDETSTGSSVADSSGNSNNGTPAGGSGANDKPQPSTNIPSVVFSNTRSLDFDGTDDEVVLANISQLPSTGDFSIAYWIYREGSYHDAFALTTDTDSAAYGAFGWYGNTFAVGNGSSYQYPIYVNGVSQNTWVHMAYVLDADNLTMKQYVDGVLTDNESLSYNPQPLNTQEFRVGRGSFSDTYAYEFDGKIDDVRVYSRELTEEEITGLADGYSHDMPGFGDDVSVANNSLSISGDFSLYSGQFTAPTGTMSISRNWTNRGGTFFHNGGLVSFDGTAHRIDGSTTFYQVLSTLTSGSRTLTFDSGDTFTIINSSTLAGSNSLNRLTIESSQAGVASIFDIQGTDSYRYLDVSDINNIALDAIDCTNGCYDGGGNTGWAFVSNDAPSVSSLVLASAGDGLGGVTVSVDVSDSDDDDVSLSVEYLNGTCDVYSGQVTTTLSSSVSADSVPLAISIDNADSNGRQVSGIVTGSGANTVTLTWISKQQVPAANGEYCVFVTPHDGVEAGTTVSSTITLDNIVPTAPGALSLVSTSTESAVIAFGAASIEPNFKEYKIFYKQGSSGVTESDTAITSSTVSALGDRTYFGLSTTTLTGLSSNTQYVFQIVAYDTYGNTSTASSELSFYTLANHVHSVVATQDTTTSTMQIQLTWTDVSQPGMKIDRDDGCDSSYDVTIYDDPDTNAVSPYITSASLSSNSCYRYRIRSYNDDGVLSDVIETNSGAFGILTSLSNSVSTPPGQPQNVVATSVDATQIVWSWDTVFGANEYRVYTTSTGEVLATISAPTVSFTQTGLTPNQSYGILVRAASEYGQSIASSMVNTVTDSSVPSGLSHTNQTIDSLRFVWNDNGQSSFFAQDKFSTGNNSGVITDAYWDYSGLSINTAYTVEVNAKNSIDEDTAYAELTRYTSQSTPTGITFSSVGARGMTITADGSFPNNGVGSSALFFTNVNSSTVHTVTSGASLVQTGLTPNTPYIYDVYATNGDGDITGQVTSSPKYTLAVEPGRLTVGTITTTTIELSIPEDANSSSTVYAIHSLLNDMYVDSSGVFTNTPVYQTRSVWDDPIVVQGLSSNTGFRFRAIAKNGDNVVTESSLFTSYVFTQIASSTQDISTSTTHIIDTDTEELVIDGEPGQPFNLQTVILDTSFEDEQPVMLNFSRTVSSTNVVFGQQLFVRRPTFIGKNYDLIIPASTTLTAEEDWDGSLTVPTIIDVTDVTLPSGYSGDILEAIEVGASDVDLTFDQPVKLLLPEKTGTQPAYQKDGDAAVAITTQCLSATDASNIIGNDECYYDDGTDIIIWTTHFTKFFVFNGQQQGQGQNTPSVSGGSGSVLSKRPASILQSLQALLINKGAKKTDMRRVEIALNVLGASMVAFSNTPDFLNASFVPFASSFHWILSSGDGEKTVYVRLRTQDGQTISASGSIVLDTTNKEQVDTENKNPDIEDSTDINLEEVTVPISVIDPQKEIEQKDPLKVDTSQKTVLHNNICILSPYHAYKVPGSSAVYYVIPVYDHLSIPCTKRPFRNSHVFFSYFDSWDDVELTTADVLFEIPDDPLPFMPYGPKYQLQDGDVVKSVTQPEIYIIREFDRYWIGSERVFQLLGFSWGQVRDVVTDVLDIKTYGGKVTEENYTQFLSE